MLTKKQQLQALKDRTELINRLVVHEGQGGGAINPETVKKIFEIVKIAAPTVKKVSLAVFKEFIKPLIKRIREKRKKKKAKGKPRVPLTSGGALRLAGQGRRIGVPGTMIMTRQGKGLSLAGGRRGRYGAGLGLAGGGSRKFTVSKFGRGVGTGARGRLGTKKKR